MESKQSSSVIRLLFTGWIMAYQDLQKGLIQPIQQNDAGRRPAFAILISLIITWFIYVPIHELLHVAGCVITGGTVSELVLGPEYGAGFLKQIFPFITVETTRYAGRITGFEPAGDIGYLVTVFAPYILSIFPGVWFIGSALRSRKLILWGPGIVIGLAPFYNLTGDFFEIGTILSTRLLDFLTFGKASSTVVAFWKLRSDDIFRLFGEISESPVLYGFDSVSGISLVSAAIIMGLALAIVIAGWIYQIGRNFFSVRS